MEFIFKEIIKKWHEVGHKENAYNEKQLKNVLYKHDFELELIENTLQEYESYFNRVKRYLYSPKWDVIFRDFPSWFDLTTNNEQEIIKAFTDESYAIEDDNAKLWIVAKVKKRIQNTNYGFLYEAEISLPDGVSAPGQEGIPINLWWQEVSEKHNIKGVFLAYHRNMSSIIFKVSTELSEEHLRTRFKFKPKPLNFLKDIKARFDSVKNEEFNLTHKLFHKQVFLEEDLDKVNFINPKLNVSQNEALNRVFSQNVTCIWGPPGTGKTYTLSKIITQACCLGMRVLAVGISNVSIDILGQEIIKEFETFNAYSKQLLEARKLLRFGYPVLPEIVNDDRLYPEKDLVNNLRKEYSTVLKILNTDKSISVEDRAIHRNKQIALKNEIKQINQKRIQESNLVFTTAAQCFIGDNFENEKFDLVIVDEVGMMPLIQTLTMSSFTKNKFVVAGDFKQLGPISIGKTEAVNNWFNKDVFQYFKDVHDFEEDVMVMLTEQHRMHPDICELINDRFYGGKLTTVYSEDFKNIKLADYSLTAPYYFIPVSPSDGALVKSTQGKSRVNNKSAQIISDLVEATLLNNKKVEIGVITPYNGQVITIKRYLQSKMLTTEQLERIKVGTIHSFQGSGFDMIIYDIVDNCEKNTGRLYKGLQGERLLNVALSRAKHKLIIVGDPKVFSVSDELEQVSKKLRSFMVELRLSKYQLSLTELAL